MGYEMGKVINLNRYAEDKKTLESIRDISHLSVNGSTVYVGIIATEALSEKWMSGIRWRITHLKSNQTFILDSCDVRLLGGVKLKILALSKFYPTLPELGSNERFRIEMLTPSGIRRVFMNRPTAAQIKKAEPRSQTMPSARRTRRPSHLRVVK